MIAGKPSGSNPACHTSHVTAGNPLTAHLMEPAGAAADLFDPHCLMHAAAASERRFAVPTPTDVLPGEVQVTCDV